MTRHFLVCESVGVSQNCRDHWKQHLLYIYIYICYCVCLLIKNIDLCEPEVACETKSSFKFNTCNMFHPKFQCFCSWIYSHSQNTPWKIKKEPTNHSWKERRMIFRTSMIMFHVNLQGCKSKENLVEIQHWHIFCWRRLATCRRRPRPCQTSGGRQSCQGLSDLRLNFYIISLYTWYTNKSPLKIGRNPKGKACLPTIHF